MGESRFRPTDSMFPLSQQSTQALEAHPIADVWPLMSDEEVERLAHDIKRQGLLQPIWIYEGKILDGRNRWKACQIAGVAPVTKPYTGDNPVAFAWAQNEERRHLNSASRAAMATEILPMLEEEAKKRKEEAGRRFGENHPQEVVEKLHNLLVGYSLQLPNYGRPTSCAGKQGQETRQRA